MRRLILKTEYLLLTCLLAFALAVSPVESQTHRSERSATKPTPVSGRTITVDRTSGGIVIEVKEGVNAGSLIQPEYSTVDTRSVVSVPISGGENGYVAFIPAKGFRIDSVIVDGRRLPPDKTILVGSAPPTSVLLIRKNRLRSGQSIQAMFSLDPRATIVANAGGNGTIIPSGAVTVEEGGTQVFTIRPALGYVVADVIVDGESVGPVNAYSFTNVRGTHTIGVLFASVDDVEGHASTQYAITATAGPNGSIIPTGTVLVDDGKNQSFRINPAKGCRVLNVIVDGLSYGSVTSYTFTRVLQSHTISVQFIRDKELERGHFDSTAAGPTITATVEGNGWINPDGIIAVESGKEMRFLITPRINNHIADLLVDGISVGPLEEYIFKNVTGSHRIEARFVDNTDGGSVPDVQTGQGTVTIFSMVTPDSAGNISPSGAVRVPLNSNQEFVITPVAGHVINDVLIDGVSVGRVDRYTFSDIRVPHSIEVRFSHE